MRTTNTHSEKHSSGASGAHVLFPNLEVIKYDDEATGGADSNELGVHGDGRG